jgi:hypothetical protein
MPRDPEPTRRHGIAGCLVRRRFPRHHWGDGRRAAEEADTPADARWRRHGWDGLLRSGGHSIKGAARRRAPFSRLPTR